MIDSAVTATHDDSRSGSPIMFKLSAQSRVEKEALLRNHFVDF